MPNWHVLGVGDFGGDGKSDILCKNTAGQLAMWEMNGHTMVQGGYINGGNAVTPDMHVGSIGDFNGDGKSDILWKSDNGTVSEWNMNGHSIIQTGAVSNAPQVTADWIVNAT